MASSVAMDEVLFLELPAPPGWQKKFMPKSRGTPKKNEIIFTAPTGEEITNRRQLKKYLKQHPGGRPISEFDWGTGETPRRSARISEKAKVASPPETEPPKKRSKKSLASKKDNNEQEAPEESEETKEVDMHEAETSEKDLEAVIEKVKENPEEKNETQDTVKNVEENQDEEQDTDGKAEDATTEEAKIEKNIETPDDTETGAKYVDVEKEDSKEPQAEKETAGSEIALNDQGELQDAPIPEKIEQAPTEKDISSVELRNHEMTGVVTNEQTGIAVNYSVDDVNNLMNTETKVQGDDVNNLMNTETKVQGEATENGGQGKVDEAKP